MNGFYVIYAQKVEYSVEVAGARLQAAAYDPARRGVFDVGARVTVGCEAASIRPLAAADSTG